MRQSVITRSGIAMRVRATCFALLLCAASAAAQTTVSGTVRDGESGEPLAGATVQVEGTSRGTATNPDGTYSVALSGSATLIVSYVGYQTARVDVVAGQRRDVSLQPTDQQIGEVVVGGRSPVVAARLVQVVPMQALRQVQAVDGRQLVGVLPGAHLQVNSRGEALVYLRGSGERQTGLYLDGAPLLVPWDARFDAGLLPGWLVGSARVVQGPSSVLYGVGAPSGAVLFGTQRLETEATFAQAEVRGSAPGSGRLVTGLVSTRRGRTQLEAGAGWTEQSAEALADVSLPFSQPSDRTRLNTDRESLTLFAKAEHEAGAAVLRGSVLHVINEKGIAPESHVEPSDARFWRYPSTRYTLGSLSVQAERSVAGGTVDLQSVAWGQLHHQQIDQYGDADFSLVDEVQDDDDVSGGLRLGAAFERPERLIRVRADALASQHDQSDVVVVSDPRAIPFVRAFTYRLFQGGVGAEWEERLGAERNWLIGGGVGVEGVATPRTGDKPARDPQAAWTASLTSGTRIGATSIRLSGARKIRFPTPRELFGEAIGRFLLNPDLRPETIYQTELTASTSTRTVMLEGAVFARRTTDSIDQLRLTVDGEAKRQRVNLDGSRTLGISLNGTVRADRITASANATAQRSEGKSGEVWAARAEVPSFTSFAVVTYRVRGFALGIDAKAIAGMRDAPDADGERPRLGGGTQLGVRGAHTWFRSRGSLEVFTRIDNALDAAIFPQAGLPLPGRTMSLGLRLSGQL